MWEQGEARRVIVDPSQQMRIIREMHSGDGTTRAKTLKVQAMAGHFGRDKTMDTVRKYYYFPMMREKVVYVLKRCESCQLYNAGSKFDKAGSEMTVVPIVPVVMRKVGIDLIGPLEEVCGQKYIVTAVDYFTKWVEAEPLPDKTAEAVADFILGLVCRYGAFEVMVSDQGREFNSAISDQVYKVAGIKHVRAAAYHPQTNGQCERMNQTIEHRLMKHIRDEKENWLGALRSVLFAIRVSKSRSTGFSPFRMLYGRDPKLPQHQLLEEDMGVPDDVVPPVIGGPKTAGERSSDSEEAEDGQGDQLDRETAETAKAVRDAERVREKINHQAAVTQRNKSAAYKHQYDKRHAFTPMGVGEKVLRNNRKDAQRKVKMPAKWSGPYTIVEVVNGGSSFVLRNKHAHNLKTPVPANHCKRWYSGNCGIDRDRDLCSSSDSEEEVDPRPNSQKKQSITKKSAPKNEDITGEEVDLRPSSQKKQSIKKTSAPKNEDIIEVHDSPPAARTKEGGAPVLENSTRDSSDPGLQVKPERVAVPIPQRKAQEVGMSSADPGLHLKPERAPVTSHHKGASDVKPVRQKTNKLKRSKVKSEPTTSDPCTPTKQRKAVPVPGTPTALLNKLTRGGSPTPSPQGTPQKERDMVVDFEMSPSEKTQRKVMFDEEMQVVKVLRRALEKLLDSEDIMNMFLDRARKHGFPKNKGDAVLFMTAEGCILGTKYQEVIRGELMQWLQAKGLSQMNISDSVNLTQIVTSHLAHVTSRDKQLKFDTLAGEVCVTKEARVLSQDVSHHTPPQIHKEDAATYKARRKLDQDFMRAQVMEARSKNVEEVDLTREEPILGHHVPETQEADMRPRASANEAHTLPETQMHAEPVSQAKGGERPDTCAPQTSKNNQGNACAPKNGCSTSETSAPQTARSATAFTQEAAKEANVKHDAKGRKRTPAPPASPRR